MHVDEGVDGPHCVSEPLQRSELLPFTRFSLVDLHLDVFTDRVRAAAQYYHQGANEYCGVLVPGQRFFSGGLIGCFDPVPSAVAVSAEAPCVL